MNKKIIKIKFKTSIIILLLMIGCSEDFISLDNPNQTTTLKFWDTEGDLVQAIAATYKALSENADGSYYMRTNPQLVAGKTENYTVSTDVIGRYEIGSYVNTMSNNNSAVIYRWNYIGIFRANQVLHYAPLMDKVDETLKNTIMGEAYFLRGLYHLHLVNEFGSVPIVTKMAESDEEYFQPQGTIPEVWAQVVSDLTAAEAALPVSWPAEYVGRATKGAAIAFKGRAYLYQGDWANAIIEYEKLYNSEATYGYDLMEDYAEIFDGKHRNCKESIFEIQYSRNKTDVWGGRTASSTVYAQEVASWTAARGWNEILPTVTLRNAMIQELTVTGDWDPRALATIAWNYPGCIYYTHKFDSVFAPQLALGQDPVMNRKFCNHWNFDEGDWRSDLNEIPMRYADVILSLAEAYTMNGRITDAVPLVTRIRTRANLVDKSATMLGWTQTEMMTEIMHQRNVELAREWVHFFDLRRWGTLQQVITDSKELGWDNFQPRNAYYPIPEMEIKANPLIVQNPLWQ